VTHHELRRAPIEGCLRTLFHAVLVAKVVTVVVAERVRPYELRHQGARLAGLSKNIQPMDIRVVYFEFGNLAIAKCQNTVLVWQPLDEMLAPT
jgi:hypothetical protein